MNLTNRNFYCIIILLLVSLAVFLPVCGFRFVNFDDPFNVYRNPYVNDFSLTNLLFFWQELYAKLYIPVTYNLWALVAKIAQFFPDESHSWVNPHIFHATNLLLHLSNSVLIFLILNRLIKKDFAALCGALLFAIHPVQVEPVAWVTGMKGLLSGFWSLLAILFYLRYIETPSPGRPKKSAYLWALFFFLLALLSKPSAVVAPLLAGVIGWGLKRSPKQLGLELAPWLILALPIVLVTKLGQPDELLAFIPSLWQRLLIAGDSYSFYFYKLFLPIELSFDYGRTPEFVLGQSWIYLTGLLPYGAAVLVFWRLDRPWMVAAAIFAVAIIPVSGLIPFTFQNISTVSDRYLYLAMLGPALGIGYWLSKRQTRTGLIIFVILLVPLGAKSISQLSNWRDPIASNTHAIKINPDSFVAHTNLGAALARQNKVKKAIALFKKAVEIKPDHSPAWYNLGVNSRRLGNREKAVFYYKKAIESYPDNIDAHKNLAELYLQADELVMAVEHLKRVTEIIPTEPDSYYFLADFYIKLGRTDEAIASLKKVLEITPDVSLPYNNLAYIYSMNGRNHEAIAMYQQAIAIEPNRPALHNNIGNAYLNLGLTDEAEKSFRKSIELDPGFGPARQNLSKLSLAKKQGSSVNEFAENGQDGPEEN